MLKTLKTYIHDDKKRPLLVMIAAIYILVTIICVMGRIFIDGIFLNYARERLKGTVYIIGNGLTGDAGDQIETVLLQQNIQHVKYAVYKKDVTGKNVLWAKTPSEDDLWNNAYFQKFIESSIGTKYQDIILEIGKKKYLCAYMEKGGTSRTTVYAYTTFDDFVYDEVARKVILTYSAAVILVALIVMTCAGLSMKAVRIKLDMEREKAKREEAEHLASATADFLTHMTHEFRTPLNVVLGLSQVIQKKTHDAQIKEHTEDIERAGLHLLSMVDDILDYARLKNGQTELSETEYDIRNMLRDIESMIKIQASKKGLEYVSEISENVPDVFYGDAAKIRRILINLLGNAVKYTDNGNVTLRLDFSDDTGVLFIEVADTGKGIKEEDKERLFKDFQRVDITNNATIQGTGLGLAIVNRLVTILHADISLDSIYGQGSSFKLSIPQKAMVKDTSLLINGESFVAPDARILIVDDTADNLLVMQNLLAHTKMHIATAISGDMALHMMQQEEFDIIFIDARMPGMTGYELFDKIKEDGLQKQARFIMLTANAGQEEKTKSMQAGFDEYLSKPVPAQKLENMIYKILGSSKAQLVQDTTKSKLPSWLVSNDLLDAEHGMEMCGSVEVYIDALRQFYLNADEKILQLQGYLKVHDLQNFTIKIHAVKGIANTIGAVDLAKTAEILEQAGQTHDGEILTKELPGFFGMYNALATMLRTVLDDVKEEPQEASEIDMEHVAGIINHLKGYVTDYNFEAVGSMLNALSQYRFPDRINDLFEDFKKAYRDIDWVQMEEIIDRIIDLT